MTRIPIAVRNLSKAYKTYGSPLDMLKEYITGRPRHQLHWALQDVSFDVPEGEVVGILGLNGSGKSTLLKIIAGTLDKTAGDVHVQGKISAILELGTGFHPEYSGRKNVILGGMCLGMSKEEVESKLESIIEFSGLREFIDQPFKTYSSGMQARLTFATATAVNPDIFIVDEALAAGDAVFVQRSLGRIKQICSGGSTVLFVSHSSPLVAQLCSRAIWLEKGRIRMMGPALEVVRAYDYAIYEAISGGKGKVIPVVEALPPTTQEATAGLGNPSHEAAAPTPAKPRADLAPTGDMTQRLIFRQGPVVIDKVELLDRHGTDTRIFRFWESLRVRVWYRCEGDIPEDTLGMALALNRAGDMINVMHCNTTNVKLDEEAPAYERAPFRTRAARHGYLEACFDPLQLNVGQYVLTVGLLGNYVNNVNFYELHQYAYDLSVVRGGGAFNGVFYPQVEWRHCPGALATEGPLAKSA